MQSRAKSKKAKVKSVSLKKHEDVLIARLSEVLSLSNQTVSSLSEHLVNYISNCMNAIQKESASIDVGPLSQTSEVLKTWLSEDKVLILSENMYSLILSFCSTYSQVLKQLSTSYAIQPQIDIHFSLVSDVRDKLVLKDYNNSLSGISPKTYISLSFLRLYCSKFSSCTLTKTPNEESFKEATFYLSQIKKYRRELENSNDPYKNSLEIPSDDEYSVQKINLLFRHHVNTSGADAFINPIKSFISKQSDNQSFFSYSLMKNIFKMANKEQNDQKALELLELFMECIRSNITCLLDPKNRIPHREEEHKKCMQLLGPAKLKMTAIKEKIHKKNNVVWEKLILDYQTHIKGVVYSKSLENTLELSLINAELASSLYRALRRENILCSQNENVILICDHLTRVDHINAAIRKFITERTLKNDRQTFHREQEKAFKEEENKRFNECQKNNEKITEPKVSKASLDEENVTVRDDQQKPKKEKEKEKEREKEKEYEKESSEIEHSKALPEKDKKSNPVPNFSCVPKGAKLYSLFEPKRDDYLVIDPNLNEELCSSGFAIKAKSLENICARGKSVKRQQKEQGVISLKVCVDGKVTDGKKLKNPANQDRYYAYLVEEKPRDMPVPDEPSKPEPIHSNKKQQQKKKRKGRNKAEKAAPGSTEKTDSLATIKYSRLFAVTTWEDKKHKNAAQNIIVKSMRLE